MRDTRALLRPLLRAGDVIDVVAPGFRCTDELLEGGVRFLRDLGLTPRVPRALFGEDLLCANSDRIRFEQLRRALLAPDSRGIWCVRGGYGALRLVPALLRLPKPPRPKLFVGYSDATTLHYFLNHHWKWPTLHGPLLDRLGSGLVGAQELQELESVVLGGAPAVSFSELIPLNGPARRLRRVQSRVFGGNLSVLQTVLGTPLQRRPRQILFLEDIGERGYRVDRMLQHLLQAGALAGVQALLFGDFLGGQDPDGRNLVNAVLERFAQAQRFPVLRGMRAGHGEHQRPVFFNTRAGLRCGRSAELTIATPELPR
ncbi:MAG TPA: LD-carboxypeptidase [Steroidobacteraceae bacterium]|nr:LD-carboxypeptidase [Steroidobacteraceae bacterium]